MYHLTEPNETFFQSQNKLPMRNMLHGGTKINVSERIQFLLHAINMHQGNINQVMISLTGYYYLKDHDAYFLYGVTKRTDDAIITHLGLKYKKFIGRLSYDVNTSTLQSISNGQGGFEISLVYITSKLNPTPVIACPDL